MSFTSIVFLVIFFPICILGNYFMAERYRNAFLCLMSLIFYAWCGLRFLLLMLILTAVDYGFGLVFAREENKGLKKAFLVVALVINIGALVYYKYLFTIVRAISPWLSTVLGREITFMAQTPALPLGISFYTFSLLSYLLDVYWEICPAQKHFGNLWLYVALFPKVVQGPILRYKDFDRQIHDRPVNLAGITGGLERFIKGMFKKVMIADQLQTLVNYSFSNITGVGTVPAWISLICYMLQLYYDFSGYSDMAVGLGRMVGFTLPENFDHPYMSSSVAEYWRRWHISLGEWFRDYVYTPCIRSLTTKTWAKRLKQPFVVCDILALLVTWTLTGIWHGSGLNSLVYGLWFCLFIVGERLRDNHRKKLKKAGKLQSLKKNTWQRALDHVVTMLAVTFGMPFFRADSMKTAWKYLQRLLIWNSVDGILMLHQIRNYTLVFLIVAVIFAFPVYEPLKAKVLTVCKSDGAKTVFLTMYRVGLAAAFFIAFIYSVSNGYMSFLYEVF